MRFKIVLINFPFDDLASSKLRPAICLTGKISRFNHLVLAAITSNISNATEPTDVIVEFNSANASTGLKTSSVIKTHRLITVSENIIQKVIGDLSPAYHTILEEKITQLFSKPK
jgi:mRNA interferase MazF